jgi:hypothetical protein
MILYQYNCVEHGVFEQTKEIDDRHDARCSKCERICPQIMGVSTADTLWKPRVMHNIAPYPVYVKDRAHLTRICNDQGNYSDFAFTKNSSRIKGKEKFILDRKKKSEIMRGKLHG